MKAITYAAPGDESVLRIEEVPDPHPAPGEVLIDVRATAVNRADLLQRRGLYPPPPGASPILGLECAGVVRDAGDSAGPWKRGDRVMALLAGGGYAAAATVDAGSVIAVPDGMTFEEAAAFPETFITAFLNLFMIGGAQRGDSVLVHGGGSGVGTAAIALCREAGVRIFVTAGSDQRCRRCESLGAERAINYRTEDFSAELSDIAVILDPIGGEYLERNLRVLRTSGKLILIATMQGTAANLDLRRVLGKRLQVIGSTLRSRPAWEKAGIISQLLDQFAVALKDGRLRPVVDRVLPLDRAAEAHRLMAAGDHFGKIVLAV